MTTLPPQVRRCVDMPDNIEDCQEWQGTYNAFGQPVVHIDDEVVTVRRWLVRRMGVQLQRHSPVRATCHNKRCVSLVHVRVYNTSFAAS